MVVCSNYMLQKIRVIMPLVTRQHPFWFDPINPINPSVLKDTHSAWFGRK